MGMHEARTQENRGGKRDTQAQTEEGEDWAKVLRINRNHRGAGKAMSGTGIYKAVKTGNRGKGCGKRETGGLDLSVLHTIFSL